MNAENIVRELELVFRNAGNPADVEGMTRYMKNKFSFYGIKAPIREKHLKEFWTEHPLPQEHSSLKELITALWEHEYREMNYAAFGLFKAFVKVSEPADIEWLDSLILTRSWWDSVDSLAEPIGLFLKKHPQLTAPQTDLWINDPNIWRQRMAIIFQLKYKRDTDLPLLFALIERRMDSKEFFVQKAIGWALRQYARIDAAAVLQFCNSHTLAPLSRREALKHFSEK